MEPLRSRTVLQIMDGLRGVWHGGPFARTTRYVFYPRQIMFGTDPVAIDRLLLDIIENERRAHGAISIWDRSPASLKIDDNRARDADPNVNIIIREPGHVEYAVDARAGRVRPQEDQTRSADGMTVLALLALSLPCLYWSAGLDSRAALEAAAIKRVCVPPDRADSWRAAGFTVTPLTDAELASRERLPSPGITPRAGVASPTRAPWVEANGWRFTRRPAAKFVYDVPAGKAALAAAEAFASGADAVLRIDAADLGALGAMLAFLATVPAVELPAVSDFAVVDDGSAVTGEVMNLLARRNLLFQVVQAPSSRFPINIRIGSPEYPRTEAADPSAFAQKIRRQLTDDRRACGSMEAKWSSAA